MKKVILIALALIMLASAVCAQNSTDTNTSIENKTSLEIVNFIPKEFRLGDVQFSIRVKNNQNETQNNIITLVSGKGFSTYDIIPIESLEPEERDYLIITGNFKETGNITLKIKIDAEVFYQDVLVINPNKDIEDIEQEKKNILSNLTAELNGLKIKYYSLEEDYLKKKEDSYDLSSVNIEQVKKYIRSTESSIITEDINGAKANLKLANEEYTDQKRNLENSKQISSILRFKDYAIIFSAIAGAFLTFFALSELLKRKGENIVGTIHKVSRKNGKKVKNR